jgi:hypothetical protein
METSKAQLKKHLEAYGEFRVASELFIRGYIATLAPKNYENFDIIAHNPKNDKTLKIQVKTCKGNKFPLGKFESEKDLTNSKKFKVSFIFVSLYKQTLTPRIFIVPGEKVAELLLKSWKDYENKPHRKTLAPFNEHPLALPLTCIEDYYEKWTLLDLAEY